MKAVRLLPILILLSACSGGLNKDPLNKYPSLRTAARADLVGTPDEQRYQRSSFSWSLADSKNEPINENQMHTVQGQPQTYRISLVKVSASGDYSLELEKDQANDAITSSQDGKTLVVTVNPDSNYVTSSLQYREINFKVHIKAKGESDFAKAMNNDEPVHSYTVNVFRDSTVPVIEKITLSKTSLKAQDQAVITIDVSGNGLNVQDLHIFPQCDRTEEVMKNNELGLRDGCAGIDLGDRGLPVMTPSGSGHFTVTYKFNAAMFLASIANRGQANLKTLANDGNARLPYYIARVRFAVHNSKGNVMSAPSAKEIQVNPSDEAGKPVLTFKDMTFKENTERSNVILIKADQGLGNISVTGARTKGVSYVARPGLNAGQTKIDLIKLSEASITCDTATDKVTDGDACLNSTCLQSCMIYYKPACGAPAETEVMINVTSTLNGKPVTASVPVVLKVEKNAEGCAPTPQAAPSAAAKPPGKTAVVAPVPALTPAVTKTVTPVTKTVTPAVKAAAAKFVTAKVAAAKAPPSTTTAAATPAASDTKIAPVVVADGKVKAKPAHTAPHHVAPVKKDKKAAAPRTQQADNKTPGGDA